MKTKFFIIIPKNPKQGYIFYNSKECLFYTYYNEQWVEGVMEDLLIGIDFAKGKDDK